TAEPRITPRIGSLSRCASDSRLSTSMPQPSLHETPSAAAEKLLQRPSGASPRSRLDSTKVAGVSISATPPASATEHSPCRNAWQARCTVTSDDEHAVSTVRLGPLSPSTYEILPDATLAAVPVPR